MSIPDYLDIASKWKQISEQGYKYIYKNGRKERVKLTREEEVNAVKMAEHYLGVAKEFGQIE